MSDEDDLLAAELAFGLLPADEARAAEAREAEPDFAAAVDRWRARAAALANDAGEAPRPSLWRAIEAKLPANDDAPAANVGWWRTGTIAASLLAAVMTIVAIERRPAPTPTIAHIPEPPLVAMLSETEGKGVVAVQYDPNEHRLTFAANAFDPGRKSAELWVIPADGKPRSLGLINAKVPGSRLSGGEASDRIAVGATLAISIEPLGGSRTGQPTGPVVMTGIVQKSSAKS